MKPSRRAQVLWGGLALLLATNAVVLGGAFYNRSGEPEATLRLSQRELGLPYRWGVDRENSGVSLELRWRVLRPATRGGNELYVEGASWLDKAKLGELGFDVSRLPYSAGGARYYAKQLPREVLLVLEFDGAAYRAALQRAEELAELKGALEGANRALENERNASSRLFVVDAGRDSTVLRAKYADRTHYAIVPGIVRLATQRRGSDWVPVGYVAGLSVAAVNVPAAYRGPFASAYKDSAEGAPRAGKYEVAVAFGKRLEPWIVDVRRNGAAGAGPGSSDR